MQNILIINLDETNSILSTSSLINSLRDYFPGVQLSFLTYDEEKQFCKLLPPLDSVFLIENKKIKSYLKGKIFPDAQAINSLEKTLSNVCLTNWDSIIHAGSSAEGSIVSSYLTTKLKTVNFHGLRLGLNKNLIPSNEWFLTQESLKNYKFNPLNSIEFLHLGNNLFFDPQISRKNSGPKKIGIHLPSNPEEEFLPFQTLIELIESIKMSDRYIPILLVDLQDINKEYFTKLNRYFNYELEIVYPSFENIKKIISLLDLLISGKSRLKYIAQAEGISIIELTNNLDDALIGPHNLILKKGIHRIKGTDIFNSLEGNFFDASGDFQTFSCIQDRIGYRPLRLYGSFTLSEEINLLMGRYLIGALYLQERDETILSEISELPQKEVSSWLRQEKEQANEISGKLLNTLRLLNLINESNSYKNDFIISLDELLGYANTECLNSIPILIFKYKIENSSNQDIKTFENHLFALKDQVQVVLSSIRDLENEAFNKKKESLIKKAFGNRVPPVEELPQ